MKYFEYIRYFTNYSNILLYFNIIIYFLLKKYPEKFTEKTKKNLKNILALSYGIVIATSLTGTIMTNFFEESFLQRHNITSLFLHSTDIIFHILPFFIINYISPKSNEVSINRIYLYSSFFDSSSYLFINSKSRESL